ncbi:11430_t:CDS:2 [Dentiscutata erythropus]|uniref:11430_t:CDS:1 n=1 Tax=Dentiscutata erythropus TaxID=1348616 RepID=A0A9N9AHE1_9GLOM|nr:11430_t:CDS:2 [Dentiscutata erythropus]
MNELSTINEYKTFAYGAPSSSENVDNSDINDVEIDSDISESENAEDSVNPYVRVNGRFLVDFRWLKIAKSDKRQQEKKSVSSKSWNNKNEMDIQVEYNSWDPYLERVVYILKDYKFENLINGQETVHWADDAYSQCPQKQYLLKYISEPSKAESEKAFYKGIAIGVIGLDALIALPMTGYVLFNAGAATTTEAIVWEWYGYCKIAKPIGTTGAALAKSRAINCGITVGAVTLTSTLVGSTSLLISSNKEKEATKLKQTLDGRKEQWLEKSANLHDEVNSTKPILQVLEMFWDEYKIQLERLNERFQSSSDHNVLPGGTGIKAPKDKL